MDNFTGAPTGTLKEVTEKGFEITRVAVMDIALPLIGILALWLCIMRLAEKAGLVQLLARAFRPVLDPSHFQTELLPMCLMRPFSGSSTLGMFTELVKEFGPDSLIARTAGTIFGSTETTFYVIAVYFGAVNIRRTRHSVPAGLIVDAVGIVASIIICRMMFG